MAGNLLLHNLGDHFHGFPVAVLPVGAPVERVKRYAKGLVLKDEKPENIVEEMISLWKTLGESELLWKNAGFFS